WLTGNEQPDHNTLSAFFRAHCEAFGTLFRQVVQLASTMGLVGLVLHAIDGTKMTAASSMHTALHRDKLQEALAQLDRAIAQMQQAIAAEPPEDAQGYTHLPEALDSAQKRREAIVQALQTLQAAGTAHLHRKEPE